MSQWRPGGQRAAGAPADCGARGHAWPVPSVFKVVDALAGIDGPEARATLNGGIGMVAVVPAEAADLAIATLAGRGLPAWRIGEVVPAAILRGARYAETGADA
jgi:phosphoribosylformylglycinamidine cyclo-ligase